jgi:hypothetical protein
MRDKSKIFIIAIVAAVAVSAYIGGRAIVGAAASLRGADAGTTAAAPGEIEATGNEAAGLLADMESPAKAPDIKRDPLAAPTAAPADGQATARAAAKPSAPAYRVTALFLDDNPTAILSAGGERTIVHVGDEIAGGRVTAISSTGVTVEGAGGATTYSYSENQ